MTSIHIHIISLFWSHSIMRSRPWIFCSKHLFTLAYSLSLRFGSCKSKMIGRCQMFSASVGRSDKTPFRFRSHRCCCRCRRRVGFFHSVAFRCDDQSLGKAKQVHRSRLIPYSISCVTPFVQCQQFDIFVDETREKNETKKILCKRNLWYVVSVRRSHKLGMHICSITGTCRE